jgi:hypothetical protein
MASHRLTDITATVTVPKSEYEDLIRTAEQMKISKRILEFVDDDAPCVLLKTVLGIEGKHDETEDDKHIADDSNSKFGKCEEC